MENKDGTVMVCECLVSLSDATDLSSNTTEVVIVPSGTVNLTGFDSFDMTASVAKEIIDLFKHRGNDVPIDFEHSTTNPSPSAGAPAQGWIKWLRFDETRGLVAIVKWNDNAKQLITSHQYKYLSPVFYLSKDNVPAMLHSVALTNVPRIHDMAEIMAAAFGKENVMPKKKTTSWDSMKLTLTAEQYKRLVCAEVLPAVEIDVEELPPEQVDELDAVGQAIEALKTALIEKGAVEEGASAVDVLGAAIGMMDSGEADEATEASLTDKDSKRIAARLGIEGKVTVASIVGTIDKMKAMSVSRDDFEEQVKKLKAFETRENEREAKVLVASYVDQGKLNPNDDAQMKWAKECSLDGREDFQKLMDGAPKLFEPGRVTPEGTGAGSERKRLIASLIAECKERNIWEPHHHVNGTLIFKDMEPLSDDERKELKEVFN